MGEVKQKESLTSNTSTVGRVVNLNNVHGACRRRNGDTETKQESASHELALGVGHTLDNGTNDDEDGTQEHAHATAESVNGRADKGKRDDTTNLVHGRDNAGPDAIVAALDVLLLEPGVLQQVVDERTIIAVHGTAEKCNDGEGVDEQLSRGPGPWRLLHHGLLKGRVSGHDLGLEFSLH